MAYLCHFKQAAAARRHYLANMEAMKANASVHRKRVIRDGRLIVAKARAVPCMDCGHTFPRVCMDFDHVRGTKLFDIGQTSHWRSVARLREEMAKCEVVCSNCHRLRTKARRDAARVAVPLELQPRVVVAATQLSLLAPARG